MQVGKHLRRVLVIGTRQYFSVPLPEEEDPSPITAWFRERGFGLSVHFERPRSELAAGSMARREHPVDDGAAGYEARRCSVRSLLARFTSVSIDDCCHPLPNGLVRR